MRRRSRLLAIALPVALATGPVALAGPDLAAGGQEAPAASASADAVEVALAPRTKPTVRLQPGHGVDVEAVEVAPAPPTTSTVRLQDRRRVDVAAVEPVAEVIRAARRSAAPPAEIAVVRPGATVSLRARPDGAEALTLGAATEFGSRRRLGVVRRAGRWLGVTVPDLPNGTLGWIDERSPSVRVERTRWSIHADVSERTVVVRRGGRVVRRLSVAVGRPGSPTPTGRFAVTDKLSGGDYGPYYGCCILAISATQPNTPPGWTGGNRMAIHGTGDPSSIGAAESAGCLRAADGDLRFLIARVPVGTPVAIRP